MRTSPPDSPLATATIALTAAAPLVATVAGGEVAASGDGWAWLHTEHGPAHLVGQRGPLGPRSLVAAAVPTLSIGATVTMDGSDARAIVGPRLPALADADAIAATCAGVHAFAWDDADAARLGHQPLAALLPALIGRGPGLTPAGDDAVCGYLAARFAVVPDAAPSEAAPVRAHLGRTGAISASLLAAAATDGQIFAAGMAMLAALVSAEAAAVAPALRRLQGLGQTTGRALLAGMLGGLEPVAAR